MIGFFSNSKTKPKSPKSSGKYSPLKVVLLVTLLLGSLSSAFLGGILAFPTLKVGFNSITLTTAISWQNKQAVINTLIDSLLNAPQNYLKALIHQGDVPVIRIDIKFKHYEKIRKKREEALINGYLNSSGNDYVPAQIRYEGRNVKVKLRLKGDLKDHYETDRWSFRIKVRGDNKIFGMKRFSIQHPMVRRYQREPLYLAHLRREGVLAPRYFFIKVFVNGNDVGLMAVEEHFSKELLESQQRREGVILRFNGDNWWAFKSQYNGRSGPYFDFAVSDVEAYSNGRTKRIPRLRDQRDMAIGLLRGFLEGKLKARDVFDLELFARYLVVTKLWFADHAMVLDNLRLYLNPITMLIEPIGFDGVPLLDVREPYAGPPKGLFYERLFDDSNFRNAYISAARRIGSNAQSTEFQNWLVNKESEYLNTLHLENPLIPNFLGKVIERHAGKIALFDESMLTVPDADQSLAIPGVRFPQVLKAYLTEDRQTLELRNIMPSGLSVIGISIADKNGQTETPLFEVGNGLNLPIEFPPREPNQFGRIVKIDLSEATGLTSESKIILTARLAGHPVTYREIAIPYASPADRPAIPSASSIQEILKTHPFLRWHKDQRVFETQPGEWVVKEDIILPQATGLTIKAGTHLLFAPTTMLLVRGPLNIKGKPENGVWLQASDPESGWDGIAIINSKELSEISYAKVENLNGVARESWILTGGVTFYEANVNISHATFKDVNAEDAINIVHSSFSLQNVSFFSTRSDALDTDFAEGQIRQGRYADIGGDGIDVSGTKISIDGTALKNINDKAFSIGEGSQADIKNVVVTGAGTGVASKDGSHTRIERAQFNDILHVAMMSYIKKPAYGPADLTAIDITTNGDGETIITQTGNSASLNGVVIEPQDMDIDALYSEGYMKK